MKPHHVLHEFADLIYTRLDLPQVPQVDVGVLVEWMKDNSRSVMGEKRLHDAGRAAAYPWRAVHACSENVWDADFLRLFPELVFYVNQFPAERWKRVCVIGQLPGEEVFLHTDPDFGLGWRVYLTHGGPKLYFQKFKDRHEDRPQTWATGGPEAMAELCDSERHWVQDSGTYPWALTSIRAAHGVSPNHGELGARVTLLLFPEISSVDWDAHRQLLASSVEKHPAIWY
jgi:hypothetical protein